MTSKDAKLPEDTHFRVLNLLQENPETSQRDLADAIHIRAKQVKIRAVPLTCERYDCDSKMGYLEALVNFALAHPDYAEPFRTILSGTLAAKLD